MKKASIPAGALHLEQIPNIGRALADDLRQIGIQRPAQLKSKNGLALYYTLNRKIGQRHDPCVADTFMAAVDFMKGGTPKPWRHFTAQRKQMLKARKIVTDGRLRGKRGF